VADSQRQRAPRDRARLNGAPGPRLDARRAAGARVARQEPELEPHAAPRARRTTPIAIRFDQVTLSRLKALATLRNKGYQTLLKEFVVERLYEEEKREGIIG
jgi:hypothetical protein